MNTGCVWALVFRRDPREKKRYILSKELKNHPWEQHTMPGENESDQGWVGEGEWVLLGPLRQQSTHRKLDFEETQITYCVWHRLVTLVICSVKMGIALCITGKWLKSHALTQEREQLIQQAEKFEEQAGYSKGKWPGIQKRGTSLCDISVKDSNGEGIKADKQTNKNWQTVEANFVVLMKINVHGKDIIRIY